MVAPDLSCKVDPAASTSSGHANKEMSYRGILVTGAWVRRRLWLEASLPRFHRRISHWRPSRRRQVFYAPSTSLNTMASAVLFDRQPFERIVR
jgi:hypothetical protein